MAVISLPHPENGNKLSGEKRMDKNADKTGLRKGIERREKSPYPKGDPFQGQGKNPYSRGRS